MTDGPPVARLPGQTDDRPVGIGGLDQVDGRVQLRFPALGQIDVLVNEDVDVRGFADEFLVVGARRRGLAALLNELVRCEAVRAQ